MPTACWEHLDWYCATIGRWALPEYWHSHTDYIITIPSIGLNRVIVKSNKLFSQKCSLKSSIYEMLYKVWSSGFSLSHISVSRFCWACLHRLYLLIFRSGKLEDVTSALQVSCDVVVVASCGQSVWWEEEQLNGTTTSWPQRMSPRQQLLLLLLFMGQGDASGDSGEWNQHGEREKKWPSLSLWFALLLLSVGNKVWRRSTRTVPELTGVNGDWVLVVRAS